MTYLVFKVAIQNELMKRPNGATWNELREHLGFPNKRPCPEWTKWLERDIGLKRSKGLSKALIWHLS